MIGAVSDSGFVTSPAPVPEKKAKKDKPATSKAKKSAEKLVPDSKYDELDKKWTDHFNRLETLLMAKTLQFTFSSAVNVTPSHSPPATIPKDSEPFFQPLLTCISQPPSPGQILTCLQSALEKTSVLHSIRRPASSDSINIGQDLPHPSTLVLTPLLSISRPASLSQTDTSQDLHLLGTLAVTPLFLNISQPQFNRNRPLCHQTSIC